MAYTKIPYRMLMGKKPEDAEWELYFGDRDEGRVLHQKERSIAAGYEVEIIVADSDHREDQRKALDAFLASKI